MPPTFFTLSLHAALPISTIAPAPAPAAGRGGAGGGGGRGAPPALVVTTEKLGDGLWRLTTGPGSYDSIVVEFKDYVMLLEAGRSEEHTSELQSLRHLVCRPRSSLFPYTPLFRSRRLLRLPLPPQDAVARAVVEAGARHRRWSSQPRSSATVSGGSRPVPAATTRSSSSSRTT